MGIRIKDDDNGIIPEVILNRENGIIVSDWDPGFPEIREVVQPYVDASGTLDSTMFHDASTANLRGVVLNESGISRRSTLQRIMAHMVPSQRSFVHWQLNDEVDERCVQVRVSRVSRPIEKHNRIYFNISLVVPKGIIESSKIQSKIIGPSGTAAEVGRNYNLSFDRTYPLSNPIGGTDVENSGNTTAWPRILLMGDCTNPRLRNLTTGKEYDFSGATIPAGTWWTIDTVNRTIVDQNGVTQMDKLDFTVSEWWGLEPGTNTLIFEPDTFGAGGAWLLWRHAWI